jgi:hypothetical protein
LKMEAMYCSETSIASYRTTGRNTLEDGTLHRYEIRFQIDFQRESSLQVNINIDSAYFPFACDSCHGVESPKVTEILST